MDTNTQKTELFALLFDASSIQQYIFGSNRLKENIGASYNVSHKLFQGCLLTELKEIFSESDIVDWEDLEGLKMATQTDLQVEVGYIGGGSALVFLREKSKMEELAKKYAKRILLAFPGIRLTIGHAATTVSEVNENLPELFQRLSETVKGSKQESYTRTTLPKQGIVQDCPSTNFAADTWSDSEKKWLSQVAVSKLCSAQDANEKLKTDYLGKCGSEEKQRSLATRFDFPLELEMMGQPDDKGYIAVIHLDGNGIGSRFKKCQTLAAFRKLSKDMREAANDALYKVVLKLRIEMEGEDLRKDFSLKTKDQDDYYLPLRPLFVGGDDIVLISEGRIGIWVAENYIRCFNDLMNQKLGVEEGEQAVVCCAGVAIVKTKYPFFRAYHLSEELMRSAKKVSRDKHASWVDFLVSSTGFNGDLEDIREDHYQMGEEKLYHGPYHLADGEIGDSKPDDGLDNLKRGISIFRNKEKWPRNKVMELRDVLTQAQSSRDYFHEFLKARGIELPCCKNPSTRHHMDMIELLEFYPQKLLS